MLTNNPFTVQLDACQLESGRYQASLRDAYSKFYGHEDKRGFKGDSKKVSREGSEGEVGFYLLYQAKIAAPFNYSVNKWAEPDFTISGKAIDVKTTDYTRSNARLFVPTRHYHKEWIYVLCQKLSFDTFSFAGYIRGTEIKEEWLDDPTGGKRKDDPCYVVPNECLHPMPPTGKN